MICRKKTGRLFLRWTWREEARSLQTHTETKAFFSPVVWRRENWTVWSEWLLFQLEETDGDDDDDALLLAQDEAKRSDHTWLSWTGLCKWLSATTMLSFSSVSVTFAEAWSSCVSCSEPTTCWCPACMDLRYLGAGVGELKIGCWNLEQSVQEPLHLLNEHQGCRQQQQQQRYLKEVLHLH